MTRRTGRRQRALFVLAVLAAAALGGALVSAAARRQETPPQTPPSDKPPTPMTRPGAPISDAAAALAEIDRLAEEQQFAAAAERAEALLARAQAAGDAETWTRALIKAVQMRTALGGFETAVDFLRAEPWPDDRLQRALLNLFYGQSLAHYQRAYAWEIRQRERVASADGALPPTLKAWTAEEIAAEAERAYFSAWELRERLGGLPVSRWSEFVEPNTHPEDVRGTLRDTVSYLFAALLADQSLWSPRESNEVHRLDVAKLLADDGGLEKAAADPAAHPLERLAGVLADLEGWHRARRARAAQLEARLVRAGHLHEALTQEEDRARIRRDLEERLPAFRQVSWWARGMAMLAELVREQDDPQALARARALAEEGRRAYPDTPGGQLALRLVREIEAPGVRAPGDGERRPAAALARARPQEPRGGLLPRLPHRSRGPRRAAPIARGSGRRTRSCGACCRAAPRRRVARRAAGDARLPDAPHLRDAAARASGRLSGRGLGAGRLRREQQQDAGGPASSWAISCSSAARRPAASSTSWCASGASGAPAPGVDLRLYRFDWERGPQQVRRVVERRARRGALAARPAAQPFRARVSRRGGGASRRRFGPRARAGDAPHRARLHRPQHLPPGAEDRLEGARPSAGGASAARSRRWCAAR